MTALLPAEPLDPVESSPFVPPLPPAHYERPKATIRPETTVRLAGIEVPERQQSCGTGSRRYRCGAAAQAALGKLVNGRTLVGAHPIETFRSVIDEALKTP